MTSVSLLLTLSTGCLKPYVKRAPSFGPEEEIEALFVSGRVMTREETRDSDSDSEEGISWGAIAEAASDIRANSMLDEFAEEVVERMSPVLEDQGVEVVFDPERTRSLQKVKWGDLDNSMTTLSGGWTDPRGASLLVAPRSLFRRRAIERVVEGLVMTPDEHALFVTVTLIEARKWLVMRYPLMHTTALVVSSEGEELLAMEGVGAGEHTLLRIDRSPTNLLFGYGLALESIQQAPVEVLD